MKTVYVESIFLLNIVMNIYLFKLTSKIIQKPTTFLKILGGSVTGAVLFCINLVLQNVFQLPVIFIMFPTSVLTCFIVFRSRSVWELLRQIGYLYTLSFLTGGAFFFLERTIPFLKSMRDSIGLILLAGVFVYEAYSWGIQRIQKKRNCNSCIVKFEGDYEKIQVLALIDTGNSLVEPISGKCVSILEKQIFDKMTHFMRPEKLKIIPFHSLGKEQGVMEGYEIEEMEVVRGNEKKMMKHVVLAVYKGKISSKGKYQMILPSELFTL